jgi:D-alanine-D-alanine ligase-like ATP-grasp enzyme
MTKTPVTPLQSAAHYTYVTRLLIELYNAGELPNVRHLDIEPTFGYVGRIEYRDGSVRMYRATNTGTNTNGAAEISKDKGYTKYFLQKLGYHTAPGKAFEMPYYHDLIKRNLSRYDFSDYSHVNKIESYIESIGGYPCFIKPNEESQGKGVYKCYDQTDLRRALEEYYNEHFRVILVEQVIPYSDYRVVIYDGELIACYRRLPLTITGDGRSSISELIQAKQAEMKAQGRTIILKSEDPRIGRRLERDYGYTLDSVPPQDQQIQLYDVSNLSTGGTSEDFTDRIHPHWSELAATITQQLGLRLCGLDLACTDITDPNAEYTIIETNAAPGLDNYAAMGPTQAAVVRDLYRRIFNEPMHFGNDLTEKGNI